MNTAVYGVLRTERIGRLPQTAICSHNSSYVEDSSLGFFWLAMLGKAEYGMDFSKESLDHTDI